MNCNWLQTPWLSFSGTKGPRRTARVRLRAFCPQGLSHGVFAQFRYDAIYELSSRYLILGSILFCLGMPSINLYADDEQNSTTVHNYAIYLKTAPQKDSPWMHVNLPGLTLQTKRFPHRLCIAPVNVPPKPKETVCSDPIETLPSGALTLADDSLYVFTTPGASERVKSIQSLGTYLNHIAPVAIRSLPLTEQKLENHLKKIRMLYEDQNMLFHTCLSTLTRISGIPEDAVLDIFDLSSKEKAAWDFFVEKEHLCRMVGLKGEPHPLTPHHPSFSPSNPENPFLATFLTYSTEGDRLRMAGVNQYKNQMAALLVFYLRLRVSDIDATFMHMLTQYKTPIPQLQQLLPGFRLWREDGSFNLASFFYQQLLYNLAPSLGDMVYVFPRFLSALGQHIAKPTKVNAEPNILAAVLDSLSFTRDGKNYQLTLQNAQESLMRSITALKSFDLHPKTDLTSPQLNLTEKLLPWYGSLTPPPETGLLPAMAMGTMAFVKTLKLMHDFLATVRLLSTLPLDQPKWAEACGRHLVTFLTGESGGTSLLNPKTFFSLASADRTPPHTLPAKETWHLTLPQAIPSSSTELQKTDPEPKPYVRLSSNTAHVLDQIYFYYIEMSQEVGAHERFRKHFISPLKNVTSNEKPSDKAGSSLPRIMTLLKDHPHMVDLLLEDDIAGTMGHRLRFLKTHLGSISPITVTSQLMFDFVSFAAARATYTQPTTVSEFVLHGMDPKPTFVPKLAYVLTRQMRLAIDDYLSLLTPWLQRASHDTKHKAEVMTYIQEYLSETATQKLFFGCIGDLFTGKSLRAIPYQPCSSTPVGYNGWDAFVTLVQTLRSGIATENEKQKALETLTMGLAIRVGLLPVLLTNLETIATGEKDMSQMPKALASARMQLTELFHRQDGVVVPQIVPNFREAIASLKIKVSSESEEALTDFLTHLQADRIVRLALQNGNTRILQRGQYEEVLTAIAGASTAAKVVPVSPTDVGLSSLRDGPPMLRTLRYGSMPDPYVFVASHAATDLANRPGPSGMRLLSAGDGNDPYFMSIDAKALGDSFFLNDTYDALIRKLVYGQLGNTLPPPTETQPELASAVTYDPNEKSFSQSSLGFPGHTYKIYAQPITDSAWNTIHRYLTQSDNPRFSMHFEGAFLDALVLPNAKDPKALEAWVTGLQKWIVKFLPKSKSIAQTWVSESFSPGLTRFARVRTHVVPISLSDLLEGQSQSPEHQEQLMAVRKNLESLTSKMTDLEQRVASHTGPIPETLQAEVKKIEESFGTYQKQLETLQAKNLQRFHPLLDPEAPTSWFYTHLHRFFPQNTEPPFPVQKDTNNKNPAPPFLHVVMHEIEVWQLADIPKDGSAFPTLQTVPKLLLKSVTQPQIRPYLMGQFPYVPGAMAHTWDAWDTPAASTAAQDQKDVDRLQQNLYLYLGGSQMIALNMRDGVWLDSHGSHRLGIDLTAEKTELAHNALSSVIHKVNNYQTSGVPHDVTPMPYRTWLSHPAGVPFVPPIAGEKFYQDILLTYDGVGPNKQRWVPRIILGFVTDLFLDHEWVDTFNRYLRNIYPLSGMDVRKMHRWLRDNEGGASRSLVHVVEALAHPQSHYWVHVHPGERDSKSQELKYHKAMRMTVWKHMKHIDVQPMAGKNQALLLVQSNEPHPLKQWVFFNLFEKAYPQHASMTRLFYTFDTDLSGGTSTTIPEESWDFSKALQVSKDGKALYFGAAPLCATYAFELSGDRRDAVRIINHQMGKTKANRLFQNFPELTEVTQTGFVQKLTQEGELLAPPEDMVGPVVLQAMPTVVYDAKSERRERAFTWLAVRGAFTPLIDAKGNTSVEGIQQLEARIEGSLDIDKPLWVLESDSVPQEKSITPRVNAWIPGMCMPLHSDVPMNAVMVAAP